MNRSDSSNTPTPPEGEGLTDADLLPTAATATPAVDLPTLNLETEGGSTSKAPFGPTPRLENILIMMVLALIWGSSFILIKKALVFYNPAQVATLRLLSAGAVLLPWALGRVKGLSSRDWQLLAISGLMATLIPGLLFSWAGRHLSSAISGSLNALSPLFTIVVGALFFRTRVGVTAMVGIALGLMGAVLLSLSGQVGMSGPMGLTGWAMLVVLATLCYAINLNILKARLAHVPAMTISAVSLAMVGAVCLIYLALFTDTLAQTTTQWEAAHWPLACAVTLGVMGTAVGLVLFNHMLKTATTVVASSVTYLMPAVAVLWGVWDGERIQAYHYLGLALIFVGVVLVNRRR